MEKTRRPEWTAENINRKKGDTTFKVCGWCSHASCGTCQYDCYLETKCSFLPSYSEEMYFDTPCKIMMLSKGDIIQLQKQKKREIEGYKERIKDELLDIYVLRSINVEDKPNLPNNRDENYFKFGKVIWAFNDNWRRGVVVPGYRSGDGCVSFVFDGENIGNKEPVGCGCSVPTVMDDKDFQYFKTHPEEFEIWLNMNDRSYNGNRLDIDTMKKAIKIKGLYVS